MALSIQKIADRDEFVRLLVYGAQGVGKTTWAASAPNPVFLDYENSSETLRGTPLENVPLAGTRKELANPDNVLDFIKSNNPYDTYIIDSVTSMNDTLLMEHMRGVSGRDKDLALFGDFRKMNNVLKRIFYELITVKKNVVLIAHQKTWRDTETNKVLEYRPRLPPEAEDAITRLVNEVFYLETKNSLKGPANRILHVDSQGKILAKNRRANLQVQSLENSEWKDVYGNG